VDEFGGIFGLGEFVKERVEGMGSGKEQAGLKVHNFHEEAIRFIDPSFGVVGLRRIFGSRRASGKTIGSGVERGGDVAKREVEQKNAGNPSINSSVRLNIGVVKHAFDVLGVYLDHKVLDSDDVNAERPECTEKAIEFEFRLGVTGFSVVPGDGPEAAGITLVVVAELHKDESDGNIGRIDCEDDFPRMRIIKRTESG
jgi:hypothetical protein